VPSRRCGGEEKHIGGPVGIVPIAAFRRGRADSAIQAAIEHLPLTHPGAKMESAASLSTPILLDLQREISTRKNEVEDRDLMIFEILELGASRMNGAELDLHTAASLRKRFDVSPKAFALILVGKDSGIKLKRDDFNGLEEIFRLIDSMPMRQNEMRHKGQGSS
jgi:hypothetical protein